MTKVNRAKYWVLQVVWLSIASIVIVACGGETISSAPLATQAPNHESGDVLPSSKVETVLASTDLGVGTNRVVFALVDSKTGPLKPSKVEVSTFFITDSGAEGPKEVKKGIFREWPNIPGGLYTAQLNFDRPGSWGLNIVYSEENGPPQRQGVSIAVKEKSDTPLIGAPAPRSRSKTLRDVDKLEELTTALSPDPDLYRLNIAEAIDTGKPLVVVFSTPAFCETATCGPQLEVVQSLKDRFKGQANFVHVEVYDNPAEMQGDISKGRTSPILTEWNLPSEPWTFVVDGDGLVSAKFEGFATGAELEEALVGVFR